MGDNIKVEGQYGGQKFDGDKPDYTLVPPDAYRAVAEVMTAGAKKYSKNNWVNLELSRVIAAMERHIEAFKSGEDYAKDSRQHHMAHAIANAMMAYHLCMNFPEQDDRIFKYILNKHDDNLIYKPSTSTTIILNEQLNFDEGQHNCDDYDCDCDWCDRCDNCACCCDVGEHIANTIKLKSDHIDRW